MFSMEQSWWQFVIMAVVCYLVGSVNFAKLISRANRGDITKMGSGNPGTMNMFRNFGLRLGALTFICDALKGGIPVVVAHLIYQGQFFAHTAVYVSDVARYFCGLFVIIGHVFPITLGFKGGKGIASTFGLFWAALSCENLLWILFGACTVLVVVAFIYVSEWGSLGSLLGVSLFCIAQICVFFFRYTYLIADVFLCLAYLLPFTIVAITWIAHKENLVRLFAGEEHHTSFKKMLHKKK